MTMWKWIKRKLQEEPYMDWNEFVDKLDSMSIEDFRRKVREENERMEA